MLKFNNENLNAMDKLCRSYGYYIGEITLCGRGVLLIHMAVLDESSGYKPPIYWEEKNYEFNIQTTSYGSLELGEYRKFVQECMKAKDIVEHLNTFKWKEITEKDFYYETD